MQKRFVNEFSIIVPHHSDDSLFEETLASILRHRPVASQVIAVHDGSYTDPYELESEIDFAVCPRNSKLGESIGNGLRIADGNYIAILRPGVSVDEGWETDVRVAFEDSNVASVSPALVSEANPHRLVASGVHHTSSHRRKLIGRNIRLGRKAKKLKPLGPTSWAAFYRRASLDQLGTPDSQIESAYVDLDFALGLQKLGKTNVFESNCIVTVADSNLVDVEARIPHGKSVARAKKRFGLSGSLLTDSFLELLQAPFKPTNLQHVLGKFSAKEFAEIDEAFARRLETRINQVEPESASDANVRELRRAA